MDLCILKELALGYLLAELLLGSEEVMLAMLQTRGAFSERSCIMRREKEHDAQSRQDEAVVSCGSC